MIVCFIGTVGSGKTLGMTREGYRYYLRGHKVFSNYALAFPHERLTAKKLYELIEDKAQLQDCVILLDELHVWLDSRASMRKKQRMITYFILQTRKRNVRLLCSTQHFEQVDKRLRKTTDILVFCRNLTNKSSLVSAKGWTVLEQQSFEQYGSNPPKREVYLANKYYELFDTEEIIDFVEED